MPRCALRGRFTSLVELSPTAEHRRGHGALYGGVNEGRIDIGRFRNVVARQQIPRCDDDRIVLVVPPLCRRLGYQDSSGSAGSLAGPVCCRMRHASSCSSGDSPP
ncbi:transposase, partial [Amycolatopsis pithecellobii]|uniref:transposase n=1 Tax=Amycolatopsis pithecellobii TaxID=664692 RepID=UPI0035E44253